MADSNVTIGVILDDFKAKMATIPGIGEREARDMAAGIRKELRRIEKDAEKTAKGLGTGFSQEFNKVSGAAAALAEKIGGPFAKLASTANSALRPLAEMAAGFGAIGFAATALTGVAVAVGAVTLAAVGLTNAAVAAEGRLVAMGHAAEIPPEARVALAEYTAATTALGVQVDILTVRIGAELAPTLSRAAAAITLLVAASNDLSGTVAGIAGWSDETRRAVDMAVALGSSVRDAGENYAWFWGQVASGGTYYIYDKIASSATKALDAEVDETKAAEDRAAATRAMIAYETKLAEAEEARRKASAATGDAQAEAKKREASARASAAALKAESDAMEESARRRAEALAANDLAIVAEEARRQAILRSASAARELAQMSAEAAEAGEDIALSIAEWAAKAAVATFSVKEDFGEISLVALGAADQIAGALGDVFDALAERQAAAAEEASESWDSLLEDQAEVYAELRRLRALSDKAGAESTEHNIEGQIAALEQAKTNNREEIKLAQDAYEESAKRQRASFVASKIAAVGQIAIQGSVALITALAQLGPIAGAIASIGIGAATGASIGVVAAQQPPEFPMGLARPSPDHGVLAALQPNERVVTSRGARDDDDVRRANEGRGGGDTYVEVVMPGRRTVASATARRGRVRVDPRAGKGRRR